jgi:molecular chaperone DnaK
MIYTAEKTLEDLGDKVPGDLKSKVEDAAAKVREVKESENLDEIKNATDALTEVLQQLGQAAYQQEGEAPAAESEPEDDKAADSGDDDEDVVDGEFKQV